jgi:hypothetical protein
VHDSGWYVDPAEDGTAVMFLVEAALGRSYEVMHEGAQKSYAFTAPPDGYNSVVALGRNAPEKKHDFKLPLDSGGVSISHVRARALPPPPSLSHSQPAPVSVFGVP